MNIVEQFGKLMKFVENGTYTPLVWVYTQKDPGASAPKMSTECTPLFREGVRKGRVPVRTDLSARVRGHTATGVLVPCTECGRGGWGWGGWGIWGAT